MGNARILVLVAGALIALILGAAPPTGPTPALATAPNDNLANAVTIVTPAVSGVVATGDNAGGSTEVDEKTVFASGECGLAQSATIASTVWYTWTSPASPGAVIFDTLGSDFDSHLAIYTGSGFPLTQSACSDNRFSDDGAISLSYGASTTYKIQIGKEGGAGGTRAVLNMTTGAAIFVTTTNDEDDSTINGFNISLREAILFATGVRGPSGLESVRVIGSPGAGSSDLIHFDSGVFAPGTIALGSALPDLNTTGDVISGVGASVRVNGGGLSFNCFSISGSGNHIEVLLIFSCAGAGSNAAVLVSGSNNVIGSALAIGGRTSIAGNDWGVGFIAPGTGNKLIGSLIGFDDGAGFSSVPNLVGVLVYSSGNAIGGSALGEGNLLADATYELLRITGSGASGNVVMGNRFGVDQSGASECCGLYDVRIDTGATFNVIGGSGLGEGNLIVYADLSDILIDRASHNVVRGNSIGQNSLLGSTGVQITGTGGFANGNTIGGSAPGEGNVVIGATSFGVDITGPDAILNRVIGNRIGVTSSGGGAGNQYSGVRVSQGTDNMIGGIAAGEGNIIAYNGGGGLSPQDQAGVVVANSGHRNTIRGNSIYANYGPGIVLINEGNAELPTPFIYSATADAVSGLACPLCIVDVYNDTGGDGRLFIGTGTADAVGAFSVSLGAHPLPRVTATNTDGYGNTSTFSSFASPPVNSDGDGLADTNDPCPLAAEDEDGFQDSDGCPDPDNDLDAVLDVSDVGNLCFDPAGTLSCGALDCRNLAEDYDAFKDTDGCPEPDNDNDSFPDATDACPGSGAIAGANGMLGSPQDVNHNGISDGAEGPLTTDDVVKTFEDYDGVLDTDGCHDSPGEDFDQDGYTDENEALFIGTNPGYPCGIGGWPSNLNDGGGSANRLDILDVTSFVAPVRHFDRSPDDPGFSARWDIKPGPTGFPKYINITDVTTLVAGPTGNPPMLNGARAFGKDCPLPP